MLTQARLKELLDYDQKSGLFTWKVKPCRRIVKGSIAGCLRNDGYVVIGFDGQSYLAHRLAWCWVTGEIPDIEVDHINGNRADNKFDNLRLATRSENLQNLRFGSRYKTGLGVSWCKREGKFRACIKLNGVYKSLGYYDTENLAQQAYLSAKAKLHPFSTLPEIFHVAS